MLITYLPKSLKNQKSKPSDWRDLEKQFGEPFEQMVKNLDFEKYLDFIAYFRERMVTAAQSQELSKLIIPIYAKIRIVQRRIVILPERMQQAIKEHRAVLKAIIEGNPEKAEQKKRINMKNARDCLEKYKTWVL